MTQRSDYLRLIYVSTACTSLVEWLSFLTQLKEIHLGIHKASSFPYPLQVRYSELDLDQTKRLPSRTPDQVKEINRMLS